MVIEQILVGHMRVFCYLIGDESTKEAILIDPAFDFDKILSMIDLHEFTVTKIINTHGHFDHIGGNRYFIKKTGAEILIHKEDLCYLEKTTTRIVDFLRSGRETEYNLKTLNDGDVIEFGNSKLTVIHTPGHSPGSICLYGEGNLFTGESIYILMGYRLWWQLSAIMKSIRKKLAYRNCLGRRSFLLRIQSLT
jgi:glyoxylase-like metal-dependent hydrolase (beta-lactamase superfamily II)